MTTIYKAEDGTEFLDKNECRKYERRCRVAQNSYTRSNEDELDPNQVNFIQFLNISGIEQMNYYGVHIYNVCCRMYHRFNDDDVDFMKIKMSKFLEFLDTTDFGEWRQFGYKTACILFQALYQRFGRDYMPRYLMDQEALPRITTR